MDMSNQEYKKYVDRKSKPSPIWRNMLLAFLFGGAICVGGQALLDMYQGFGLQEEQSAIAASVTLIVIAALLAVKSASGKNTK